MGGRIALLIGTGSFEVDALPQLHAPATDVRELAAVLRDPYAGGFDAVVELIDASTQQVGREIVQTLDRCRRDDLVLLYFSGYALLDEEGQLHLAMRDSEPDLLSPTSISAAFVAAEFDRSRSRRQLVILDCRAGSGFAHGSQELPSPQAPDAQQIVSAFHADGHPRVILAGCKQLDTLDRHSRQSLPTWPGSQFTQALVSGMRGAADSDGDGRISIDDLFAYAAEQHSEQVPARAGNAVGSLLIANAAPRSSAPPRASSTPRGPRPGSLISDRYRILSVLADRGIGVVCSAIDEQNGRHVSIKCLRPPQSSESGTLQRFLREAEVAGAIDHPGLLTIYDVGFQRSTAFIVMEPLAGESLAAMLRRQRRLGIRETLEIVLQVTAAIGAAHAQRIVHRDLNPEHIFVGRDADGTLAQVKVLGFGASTLLDDTGVARAGGLIGSPHYMAPEQVLGGDPPDARVDVYAIGVILYEALSGQRPFEADNHGALLFKISNETPPAPSSWAPDLPAALEAIVLKAMSRDRTQRYADVEDLRLSLYESGLEHGWIRASMPPPLPVELPAQPLFVPKVNTPLVFDRPPSSTLAPRPRRWPITLGLSAALVAGGAAWFLTAPKPSLPGVTTTPLVQPKRTHDPVDPLPSLPPTAAKAPEPAVELPAATSATPAEPAPPPSAAAPAVPEANTEANTEAGSWRARLQARTAERRAAREARARERAEAAAQAAQARAAAAEARAEAAAEAAAIRAATRKANRTWSTESEPPEPRPRLQIQALPDELPELKPTPQPAAAERAAPPTPPAEGAKPGQPAAAPTPPAQGPKPEPPPAPTE